MTRRRRSTTRRKPQRSAFLIETADVDGFVASDGRGQPVGAVRLELTGSWTHGTRQRITAAIPSETARALGAVLPRHADEADKLLAERRRRLSPVKPAEDAAV